MKHILLTRMKFDDDELFNHYFEVMKNFYIPSVKSQTNKNFIIGIIINEKHKIILEKYFGSEVIYFNTISEAKEFCEINNFNLQTRHDCDDWMRYDYIDTIQSMYIKNIDKKDIFLIHSKVQKFNHETNELYNRGDILYDNNTNISMFLTLCQKNVKFFIYEKDHTKMKTITNEVFLLEEGITKLIIHGKNKLSKIHPKDLLINKENNYDISIIIPTFDNVEFIDDCINSILDSSKNFRVEVLIGIDNCEKTKEYVIKNINFFKKNIIFYFFEKKVGPYAIRNSLAKISNSKNLLFFDSDDILKKEAISLVLNKLENYDIIRCKFCNFKLNDEINSLVEKNISGFYSVGQLAIKKEKFMSLNGFEPWVCAADAEFQSREKGINLNTLYLDKVLFYRRRHDKNITILPETNLKSNIRQKYHNVIEERKKLKIFNSLIELPITTFFKINQDSSITVINDYCNLHLFNDYQNHTTIKINKLNNKKLSIIIPTYKNVQFLPQCFDSILKSIRDLDCEILVGIDNCQDTLKYINNNTFDSRFKFYFFEKNIGPYVVKNTLADISSSDKLLFFDSDDIMIENLITDVIDTLNNHKIYRPMYFDFVDGTNPKYSNNLRTNHFGYGVIGIDKQTFLSVNGFEGWRCEADNDFLNRISNKNIKTSFGKSVSFLRRIHRNGLTSHPNTSYGSKLRETYKELSKKNRENNSCKNLAISNYKEINVNYINSEIREKIELIKHEKSIILSKLLNFNKTTTVDYEKINQVISPKEITNEPKKEHIIQNLPKNRNEVLPIKKDSNTNQITKILPVKPDRRKNIPNIFSGKKRI